MALAKHFLKTYPQVERVEINLSERCWSRIQTGGKPHAHSFTEKSPAKPFARIVCAEKETLVESGIEDLLILKTTGSGFEKFLRDEFTTLPETSDRIFATKLKATWTYTKKPKSYSATNGKILAAMLATFAKNFSPSVQVTLFQMGEAALKTAPQIEKVHLAMPNKHCLLINLAPSLDVVRRRNEERQNKNVFEPWSPILDRAIRETMGGIGLWLDNSNQTPEETVDEILQRAWMEGTLR